MDIKELLSMAAIAVNIPWLAGSQIAPIDAAISEIEYNGEILSDAADMDESELDAAGREYITECRNNYYQAVNDLQTAVNDICKQYPAYFGE